MGPGRKNQSAQGNLLARLAILVIAALLAASNNPGLAQSANANQSSGNQGLSPAALIAAPALANQVATATLQSLAPSLVPINSAMLSTAMPGALGQTVSQGALSHTGALSAHASQLINSRLSALANAQKASSSVIPSVVLGVAAGVLVGVAVYKGIKTHKANRRTIHDALQVQQQGAQEQLALEKQRQELNERLAAAAEQECVRAEDGLANAEYLDVTGAETADGTQQDDYDMTDAKHLRAVSARPMNVDSMKTPL